MDWAMRLPNLRQERRREMRRTVTGIALRVQRTRVILGAGEPTVHPCKILNASDHGYCVSLNPMPKLEIGDELILEHTDRTQCRVRVCWMSTYEAGLKVVEPGPTTR